MNLDWLNWEWIDANKEWLFSGVGLSVIGILFSTLGFAFILYRMHRQRQQTIVTQHHSKWLLISLFVVSVIGCTPSPQELVSEAESLVANGELKMTQLAYREAGEYYERAAKLLPSGNDEVLADYLNEAGEAFYYAALYDKAKPLFERALAIHEKVHGPNHPDVATSLNNLAMLYEAKGEYDQAKPLYERSLAIYEKVHGKEHPLVATSLNNLAGLYYSQGNYDQAKPLFERSLKILNKFFEPDHPNVRMGTKNYNRLLSKMDKQ